MSFATLVKICEHVLPRVLFTLEKQVSVQYLPKGPPNWFYYRWWVFVWNLRCKSPLFTLACFWVVASRVRYAVSITIDHKSANISLVSSLWYLVWCIADIWTLETNLLCSELLLSYFISYVEVDDITVFLQSSEDGLRSSDDVSSRWW